MYDNITTGVQWTPGVRHKVKNVAKNKLCLRRCSINYKTSCMCFSKKDTMFDLGIPGRSRQLAETSEVVINLDKCVVQDREFMSTEDYYNVVYGI